MEEWIAFWKIMSIVGFVSFYILVLFVVPLGAKDLLKFFRRLKDAATESRDEE